MKEINKVFLSLFSVGIMLIAIFIGVSMTKTSYALFTDTIKGEKTIEVVVDNFLNKTTVFNYTGDSQEYEVPKDGYYYIEMAGAEGGSARYTTSYTGGKGAKTSGYVYLEKGDTLYFYVGGMGSSHSGTTTDTVTTNGNGYNGESKGNFYASNSNAGGGGGATDVRLIGGDWDDTSSLISRIMVAGGGVVENHIYMFLVILDMEEVVEHYMEKMPFKQILIVMLMEQEELKQLVEQVLIVLTGLQILITILALSE